MKRIVISAASISGLFFAVTLLSNLSVKGNSGGRRCGFWPPGNVVTSANLTPDPATGRPAGFTLEQFEIAIRTGHDPVRNDNLAVMPWPIYRHMTDRDLEAIYAYLTAIPSAMPPSVHCTNSGQ